MAIVSHPSPSVPTSGAELARNLAAVRARIVAAAGRAGREADEVVVVAVSKTVPLERLRSAPAAGRPDDYRATGRRRGGVARHLPGVAPVTRPTRAGSPRRPVAASVDGYDGRLRDRSGGGRHARARGARHLWRAPAWRGGRVG